MQMVVSLSVIAAGLTIAPVIAAGVIWFYRSLHWYCLHAR